LRDATALVVGSIIGTGIFIKTAGMAALAGSPGWVLLAWIVGGALSLTGALAYGELGSLLPRAGGEYAYLREAYGDVPGFLYGWMRFWIGNPGSVAAYAVGAATFLSAVFNIDAWGGRSTWAVAFIVVFSTLNCLTVKFGGMLQSVMTAVKVGMILFLMGGLLFVSPRAGTVLHFGAAPSATSFGAALLAALWAYDGWNNLPMAGGEVRDAQKNLPLALLLGMIVVLLIYGGINVAYFRALPWESVLASNSKMNPDALPVATNAALTFLGGAAAVVVSYAFVFSALGAMNGSVLTGARVPYAMAKDGLFVKWLAQTTPHTHVPARAIAVQGLWACMLALSGTFDQLTDYVVFSSWIFYGACGAAVIVLRRKMPNAKRGYRVPGYPYVPLLFVACTVLLLANTLYTAPRESGVGLLIIAVGLPAYAWFKRKR
jgi:APA family basic amino acid/polyamine antiporter